MSGLSTGRRSKRERSGPVMEPLLTVQEAADQMRVSAMTVYRLIETGELPAIRIRRSFRVSESDLDTYLAAHYTTNYGQAT